MNLLAFDCSTEACSVALSMDGEIVEENFQLTPREHTQRLLPMIDDTLNKHGVRHSGLSAIAFGQGPGSFTGLRIAAATAQGLAFAKDLPVVPISTLAALAQTAVTQLDDSVVEGSHIISTIDARMNEIYWAAFKVINKELKSIGSESLIAPKLFALPESILTSDAPLLALGNGLNYEQALGLSDIAEHIDQALLPRASAIIILAIKELAAGRFCRADQAVPVYLRDEVAWQKQPASKI